MNRIVNRPFAERRRRLSYAPILEPRIVEYPQVSQFLTARARVDPSGEYTLRESAEITGVDRSKFALLVLPTASGNVRFKPLEKRTPNGAVLISGTVLLEILDYIDTLPAQQATTTELASVLGRNRDGLARNMKMVNGRRMFTYERINGGIIHVPMHRAVGFNEFVIDARALAVIRREEDLKQKTVSWEEAVDIFVTLGVDVKAAELFTNGHIAQSDGSIVFRFISGGERRIVSVNVNKAGRRGGIRFPREEIVSLAHEIRREQETWMPLPDFERMVGDRFANGSCALGFAFTLDYREHSLEVARRGNRSYVRREAARAYTEWRTLRESQEYTRLFMCYRGGSTEQTVRRKAILEQALKAREGGMAIVVSPKYGIAVKVREFSGSEKVANEWAELVQFYLTVKTAERIIGPTIKRLAGEVVREPVSPRTILKLWILRDYYMDINAGETGFEYIDSFFADAGLATARSQELMRIPLEDVLGRCGKGLMACKPEEWVVAKPNGRTD